MNYSNYTYQDFKIAIDMPNTTQDQLEDQNHHSLWTLGEVEKLKASMDDVLGLVKSLEYICKMLCYDDYINEILPKDVRQGLIFSRDSIYLTLKRKTV